MQVAWFNLKSLKELDALDIHVRVVDGAGDVHAMDILVIDKMPSVVKDAVAALR